MTFLLLLLQILFVRGRGLLAFGQNIEEAFHYAYHVAKACEIQVLTLFCVTHNMKEDWGIWFIS